MFTQTAAYSLAGVLPASAPAGFALLIWTAAYKEWYEHRLLRNLHSKFPLQMSGLISTFCEKVKEAYDSIYSYL